MQSALFLGDGFSTDYTADSWPCVLTDLMGWQAVNLSKPCSSFSYSFLELDRLLRKKRQYHTVIFTVTSMDRLYHSQLILHQGFPGSRDGSPVSPRVIDSLNSYYDTLYDPKWTRLGWIMAQHALASLSLEYPYIKFVIIPAFNSERDNIVTKGNMAVLGPRLLDFSMLDRVSHQKEHQGLQTDRHCHLSLRQNHCLALQIKQVLEKYSPCRVDYVRLENMDQL